MEKIKAYLAGKVKKAPETDWRLDLFSTDDVFKNPPNGGSFDRRFDKGMHGTSPEGFEYVGPMLYEWSGGHSSETQGLHGTEYGRSESGIMKGCLISLSKADAVFVWSDCKTAYGTLSEIGFAKALGKPVFLAVSQELAFDRQYASDFWFSRCMCDKTYVCDDPKAAWKEFTDFANFKVNLNRKRRD